MGPARSHCATLLLVSKIFDVVLVFIASRQEVMVTVNLVIGKRQMVVVVMWTLTLQRQIFTLWMMPAGREDRSESASLSLSLPLPPFTSLSLPLPLISDISPSLSRVPYLAVARTFEKIEEESKRLKIVSTLTNLFRSVILLSPNELLPCVYLCLNKVSCTCTCRSSEIYLPCFFSSRAFYSCS